MIDNYYLIEGSLLGLIELVGVGITIAILISIRRARTEARRYVYSPTYRPTMRTPKWVFLPFPLLVSTLLVIIGVRDIWHGLLDASAIFVSDVLLWIIFIGIVAQLILLAVTTKPITHQPPETLSDRPANSGLDKYI